MGRYKLIVLSNAVAGREDDFNAWYTDQHLDDVVAVPGYLSAQRFRLTTVAKGAFQNKYLAIYDMETDDPEGSVQELLRMGDTGELYIADSLDYDTLNVAVFEEMTPKVTPR